MAHFDETSGHVACDTPWGKWYQTMDEVFIEVNLPEGTPSKLVKCAIKPKTLSVTVNNECIIEGQNTGVVKADDAVWTVEDRKLLRICLPKSLTTAAHGWKSLLVGQYVADPQTFDEMEKKLTLQRYQLENPGFDFSSADISGNYQGGGPQMPAR